MKGKNKMITNKDVTEDSVKDKLKEKPFMFPDKTGPVTVHAKDINEATAKYKKLKASQK